MVSLSPDPSVPGRGFFLSIAGACRRKICNPLRASMKPPENWTTLATCGRPRQYAPAKHCRSLFLSSQVCVAPRTATLALCAVAHKSAVLRLDKLMISQVSVA